MNLKDKFQGEAINKDIEKENFDICLKIGGFLLHDITLKLLKNKSKRMISHHWDTLEFAKNANIQLEKKYFDKISSFYKKDCENHNLKYLPNFYSETLRKEPKIKNDIYAIMTDKTKKELLENIGKLMKEQGISTNLNLFIKDLKEDNEYINILNKFIPLDEVIQCFKESKCILEINRNNSKGYTMRTFDAIGLKKKLITTNKSVVNEDFYRPNNILVIDEENIVIPKEFIDSPYEELPKEIYEKYSLENWVKQLMNIGE